MNAATAASLGVASGSTFVNHSYGSQSSHNVSLVVLNGISLGELIPDLNIIA